MHPSLLHVAHRVEKEEHTRRLLLPPPDATLDLHELEDVL
jgi:hypothetical protein